MWRQKYKTRMPTPIEKPGFVGLSDCECRVSWGDASNIVKDPAFNIECTFSFERREDVSDEVCHEVIKSLSDAIARQVIDPSRFHVNVGDDYQRLPVLFRESIQDGTKSYQMEMKSCVDVAGNGVGSDVGSGVDVSGSRVKCHVKCHA